MRTATFLMVLGLLIAPGAMTESPENCMKYKKEIERIKKQMKGGYKEPLGNKLRERRREQKELLRQCEKNNKKKTSGITTI